MEEMNTCKCCGTQKPLSEFNKNAWGYKNVCRECENKHRDENRKERKRLREQALDAMNARTLKLNDFSPRELMAELKRRGYDGELTYTRVEKINLADM